MKGIRYQKRIKILPGIRLNLSKTGRSLTIGGRFLKLNFGRRGVWFTGSLSGTGLSYRKQIKKASNK
ncbi:DUF4236 domain-containing protein [Thaumasiovibrio sp. DFM-14]|uniref:DUF4236 domain-containing protein n=1 Tax=Thaumasiovibrio sp. DFM-14 TaxID=3384792 RepID=UPI0039A2107A